MARVMYLVAASEEGGVADAQARGWSRIARSRFATPERDDVRVVWRFADLVQTGGLTMMIKGADYDTSEAPGWLGTDESLGEKEQFDRFATFYGGEWVNPGVENG